MPSWGSPTAPSDPAAWLLIISAWILGRLLCSYRWVQLTRRTSAPITQLEIGKGLQRETEPEARSPSPHLGHCGVSLVSCVSECGGEVSMGGFVGSRPGFEASLSLTTCCLSFPGLFPQVESHEDSLTTATYLQGW